MQIRDEPAERRADPGSQSAGSGSRRARVALEPGDGPVPAVARAGQEHVALGDHQVDPGATIARERPERSRNVAEADLVEMGDQRAARERPGPRAGTTSRSPARRRRPRCSSGPRRSSAPRQPAPRRRSRQPVTGGGDTPGARRAASRASGTPSNDAPAPLTRATPNRSPRRSDRDGFAVGEVECRVAAAVVGRLGRWPPLAQLVEQRGRRRVRCNGNPRRPVARLRSSSRSVTRR